MGLAKTFEETLRTSEGIITISSTLHYLGIFQKRLENHIQSNLQYLYYTSC